MIAIHVSKIRSNLLHYNSDNSHFKLTKHTNKNQRFKPYPVSKCNTIKQKCKNKMSLSLTDVLLEHTQLRTSVSFEDHFTWDLVDVVVEIPDPNKYIEISTRQQLSGVQTILPAHFDLSQQSPQGGTDDFSLSVESDV